MLIPACSADAEPLCGRTGDRLVFKDRFHDHHQPADARAEHYLHVHCDRRADDTRLASGRRDPGRRDV